MYFFADVSGQSEKIGHFAYCDAVESVASVSESALESVPDALSDEASGAGVDAAGAEDESSSVPTICTSRK